MKSFDYENLKAVGIVEPVGSNAYIYVVGYSNRFSYNFSHYTEEDAKEFFPKKGKVFAYNFNKINPNLAGCCVGIAVKPSDREGEDLDDYVWDWSDDVHTYSAAIIDLDSDILDENGGNNYKVLEAYNLLNISADEYIFSNGRIYLLKANSIERMISYWTISDIEKKCPDSLIAYNSKYYIVGRLCEKSGVTDITNDNQLIDWFARKILKPNWNEIIGGKDYKKVESHIKEVLSGINLDSNIYESRLDRLKTINTNYALTLENIEGITKNPWFADLISTSISDLKEHYIEEIDGSQRKELEELKEKHIKKVEEEKQKYEESKQSLEEDFNSAKADLEHKLEEVKKEIEKKQIELGDIEHLLSEKADAVKAQEDLLQSIKDRKDDIIQDFSIVREVIGRNRTALADSNYKVESDTSYCSHYDEETEPAVFYQVFLKRLEMSLHAFEADGYNKVNIPEVLTRNLCVVAKSLKVIYSIILATGNCKCLSEYVAPDWKSFKDLWDNGLDRLVKEAKKEPGIMHYLILRNMNLSYIPSYMQVIIDIQYGFDNMMYLNGEKFPDNIRILGTINDDTLIPVTKSSLTGIGCVCPLAFGNSFNSELISKLPHGYLTPDQLNATEDKEFKNEDFTEHYLTQDE